MVNSRVRSEIKLPNGRTECCGPEDFIRLDEINHQPGCMFYPSEYERKSLAVNSVKVLTAQLNEALKNAAAEGVKVEMAINPVADFTAGKAASYMVLSVQASAIIE